MIERKYQLTRLGQGDYLLADNNGRTLWRIALSLDTGPDGRERNYWGVWRWHRTLDQTAGMVDLNEVRDWDDQWQHVQSWCNSRNDAIQEALRLGVAQ